MTDLRKAAEMALEALNSCGQYADAWHGPEQTYSEELVTRATKALRQSLAQPEQDPVAWVTFNAYGEEDDVWYENPEGKLLDGWTYKPLYTVPPKREWVGITKEDKKEILEMTQPDERGYVIAITEAKLKDKNGG